MGNANLGRYVVQKAEGVGGKPIPEDEPCIVIRGQDVLASVMLELYLLMYARFEAPDFEVIAELTEHQSRLHEWQEQHLTSLKLADR